MTFLDTTRELITQLRLITGKWTSAGVTFSLGALVLLGECHDRVAVPTLRFQSLDFLPQHRDKCIVKALESSFLSLISGE